MGSTRILRPRVSLVVVEKYACKKKMARIGWHADDIGYVAT